MFLFLPIILFSVVIFLFVVYLVGKNNERYWKKRGVKFYDRNKVTGVFWDYITEKNAMFENFGKIYNEFKGEPAVGVGSIMTPALFVTNTKNVQHVLHTDFNSFFHRGFEAPEGDQLADNVLFMNGPRWKLMRQNMTPLFTASKLKNMFYIIDKSAQDFVEYLQNNPKYWKGGCYSTVTTFCSAAVCGAIFGIDTKSVFDSPFLNMALNIFKPSFINNMKFAMMNLSQRFSNFLGIKLFHKFEAMWIGAISDVIAKRKKENVKRHDFADVCIHIQNNGMMRDPTTGCELEPTNGILAAQAMFFLLAGVEPVTIVIFTSLMELGRHPDILEKVHREIDESFDRNGKSLTYDIIIEMTYVDQVLNEAMRKNPPVGYLTRQCMKDTTLPVGNIPVKKGTKMFTALYHIHNDPDIYSEPHVFDPERFAKGSKQSEEYYMPFGMGNRTCIGARYSKLQMAAGLVHLLRHFTVKTKELGGPKFKHHFTSVTRIDADVEFIPRNIK